MEYCAASDAYTHCPEGFGEFYTQRRRWAPSTMANIMDLLSDSRRTVKINENICTLYILYQAMLMAGTILSPGTIFLMLVGAMNGALRASNGLSFALNGLPILLFIIVCFTAKNDVQILLAQILSTLYALLMLAVLVGTAIDIIDNGIFSPSAIFFVCLIASFIIAAVLHPQELLCVIHLVLYMLCIPSMYLLLTIYSIINLHVVSWGTREVATKLSAHEQEALKKAQEEAKKKEKKKLSFDFLNLAQLGSKGSSLFTCICCANPDAEPKESTDSATITQQLCKFNDTLSAIQSTINNSLGTPNQRESVLSNSSRNSMGYSVIKELNSIAEQNDINNTLEENSESRRETLPAESLTTSSEDNAIWLRDKIFKAFRFATLSEEEKEFWKDFINMYLLPLDKDAEHEKRIANELKELRNRVVFAFGMINALFILLVFLLQTMHGDLFSFRLCFRFEGAAADEETGHCPPPSYSLTIDAIGFALIVFFGSILLIQFIGMILHRCVTISHLLAFVELDFCSTGPIDSDDLDLVIDKNGVEIAKELQKLKFSGEEQRMSDEVEEKGRPAAASSALSPQNSRLDKAFEERFKKVLCLTQSNSSEGKFLIDDAGRNPLNVFQIFRDSRFTGHKNIKKDRDSESD